MPPKCIPYPDLGQQKVFRGPGRLCVALIFGWIERSPADVVRMIAAAEELDQARDLLLDAPQALAPLVELGVPAASNVALREPRRSCPPLSA